MPNVTRDLDAKLLRVGLSGINLGDVLEIGCGTGKNTKWLVRYGRVIGLDISTKMLAQCRAAAPAAELHIADLTLPWPVDDGTVDTIVVDLVLEHIEDLDHIACESVRVLRGGGRVRVSELHPWLQHEGKAARFEDAGVLVETPTFVHTTEEYVTAFLRVGFVLDALCEPRSPVEPVGRPPRLVVMEFSLPSR
jgi:SAM-dependent methyltransferase